MHIKMNVYAYKDIVKVCGGVVDPKDDRVPAAIQLKFEGYSCMACACSSFTAAGVGVNIDADAPLDPLSFWIPVVKTPAGTKLVEFIAGEGEQPTMVFSDSDGDVLKSVDIQPVDTTVDAGNILESSAKKTMSRGNGDGVYSIVVNPALLIQVLEGVKQSEQVTLTFGAVTDPIVITPSGDHAPVSALGIVLPKRWFPKST